MSEMDSDPRRNSTLFPENLISRGVSIRDAVNNAVSDALDETKLITFKVYWILVWYLYGGRVGQGLDVTPAEIGFLHIRGKVPKDGGDDTKTGWTNLVRLFNDGSIYRRLMTPLYDSVVLSIHDVRGITGDVATLITLYNPAPTEVYRLASYLSVIYAGLYVGEVAARVLDSVATGYRFHELRWMAKQGANPDYVVTTPASCGKLNMSGGLILMPADRLQYRRRVLHAYACCQKNTACVLCMAIVRAILNGEAREHSVGNSQAIKLEPLPQYCDLKKDKRFDLLIRALFFTCLRDSTEAIGSAAWFHFPFCNVLTSGAIAAATGFLPSMPGIPDASYNAKMKSDPAVDQVAFFLRGLVARQCTCKAGPCGNHFVRLNSTPRNLNCALCKTSTTHPIADHAISCRFNHISKRMKETGAIVNSAKTKQRQETYFRWYWRGMPMPEDCTCDALPMVAKYLAANP